MTFLSLLITPHALTYESESKQHAHPTNHVYNRRPFPTSDFLSSWSKLRNIIAPRRDHYLAPAGYKRGLRVGIPIELHRKRGFRIWLIDAAVLPPYPSFGTAKNATPNYPPRPPLISPFRYNKTSRFGELEASQGEIFRRLFMVYPPRYTKLQSTRLLCSGYNLEFFFN